jgi:sugar lactone lactonase YvrE
MHVLPSSVSRLASAFLLSLIGLSASFLPTKLSAQSVAFAGTQTVLSTNFLGATGVAVDGSGNVYVSDAYDAFNSGIYELVAVNGHVPANPTMVTLTNSVNTPYGLAVDASGNVYVADTFNGAVKEILAVNGVIPANPTINILGSGFSTPYAVAVDASGNVYVADTTFKEMLAVNGSIPANPTIRTLADISAVGIALDGSGDAYISDSSNGNVDEILAVNGSIPSSPTVRTILSLPSSYFALGLAFDPQGDLYVSGHSYDGDHLFNLIEKVLAVNGVIPANPAVIDLPDLFQHAYGLATDPGGNLFVADEGENPGGCCQSIGTGVSELQFNSVNFGSINICPTGQTSPAPCTNTLSLGFNIAANTTIGKVNIVTTGSSGLDFQPEANDTSPALCTTTTYSAAAECVVDVTFAPTAPGERNGAVQIVDPSGNVLSTTYLFGIGLGPALAFQPGMRLNLAGASINTPTCAASDASGNIFVCDYINNAVDEILASNGTVRTLATGFNVPRSIAVDGNGNVFVADENNNAIKEILAVNGAVPASPTVNTLGSGFDNPRGVAVDGSGNVYVADTYSNAVKEILALNGVIPANPTIRTLGSGFSFPQGITVDWGGNVFVAQFDAASIKVIQAVDGVVPANPLIYSAGSGFTNPIAVAVDAHDNIFVFDDSSTPAVLELLSNFIHTPGHPITVSVATGFLEPYGLAIDPKGNLYIADAGSPGIAELDLADPPILNFASTIVGNASSNSPFSIQLQNIGNTTLTGSGTLSDTTDFPTVADVGPVPDCNLTSLTLFPGYECNLGLSFTPQSVGKLKATITLSDNSLNAAAPNLAVQTIDLSGIGISPQGQLLVASLITLPSIATGSSETANVTVKNIGGHSLTFTTSIIGPNYSVLTAGNTCTGLLERETSCTLPISFHPPGVGLHTNPLNFLPSAGTAVTANLRGLATGLGDLSESSLNFGSVATGASENLAVTFKNFGESGSPTFTATPNNTNYSVTGSTCSSAGLSNGQTCTLTVTFAPTTTGTHNAGLIIQPSAGPSTNIELLGTATAP